HGARSGGGHHEGHAGFRAVGADLLRRIRRPPGQARADQNHRGVKTCRSLFTTEDAEDIQRGILHFKKTNSFSLFFLCVLSGEKRCHSSSEGSAFRSRPARTPAWYPRRPAAAIIAALSVESESRGMNTGSPSRCPRAARSLLNLELADTPPAMPTLRASNCSAASNSR